MWLRTKAREFPQMWDPFEMWEWPSNTNTRKYTYKCRQIHWSLFDVSQNCYLALDKCKEFTCFCVYLHEVKLGQGTRMQLQMWIQQLFPIVFAILPFLQSNKTWSMQRIHLLVFICAKWSWVEGGGGGGGGLNRWVSPNIGQTGGTLSASWGLWWWSWSRSSSWSAQI